MHAEADDAALILEGRLHPASIFFAFLAGLRRTAFWLAIIAFQAVTADSFERVLTTLWVMALVGVMSLVGPVVQWLRYRYRLTSRELAIDSGFVRRQQRRIPVSRVQDLSFEAGPLHRLLGVVVVSVQTSGTEGAEAKLDVITRSQGDALRDALRSLGGAVSPGHAPIEAAGEGASTAPALLSVGVFALILRGLTDNRAGLILAGLVGFLSQAMPDDDLSFFVKAWEHGQRLFAPIAGQGTFAIAAFVATVVAVFVLAGWVGSAALNVMRFYGFTLREDRGVFSRSYGLFTKRVHALPRVRIQVVRLRQTLLRRLLGLAELRTDDMGAGAEAKTAEAQGTDVFVPIAPRASLTALLPRVLPEADVSRYHWTRTSPRIVRRSASRGALLGSALGAGLYGSVGLWALAAPVAIALLGAIWGVATLRTLTWAHDQGGLAVWRGVFRRSLVVAPASRMQALNIVQSPFDRWHGVATLIAIAGGGARVTVPNVPVDEARAAIDRLFPGRPQKSHIA